MKKIKLKYNNLTFNLENFIIILLYSCIEFKKIDDEIFNICHKIKSNFTNFILNNENNTFYIKFKKILSLRSEIKLNYLTQI